VNLLLHIADDIKIHFFLIPQLKEKTTKFYEYLSPKEKERISQYKTLEKKERFIVCRGKLKEELAGYLDKRPSQVEIQYSKFNKPFVDDESKIPLHFNLSHSQDLLAIGLSLNTAVGIDIEYCRPRKSIETFVQRFYSPEECRYFFSSDLCQRDPIFYQLWTLKEAYQKANDHLFSQKALKHSTLQGLSKNGMTKNGWKLQVMPFDQEFKNYVGAFCFKKRRG